MQRHRCSLAYSYRATSMHREKCDQRAAQRHKPSAKPLSHGLMPKENQSNVPSLGLPQSLGQRISLWMHVKINFQNQRRHICGHVALEETSNQQSV